MFIYKITNLLNNKIYIGQTTRSIKLRFKEHIESALYDKTKNTHLYKAIKKYGKNNFKIELIEECKNIEHLNEQEKFYIEKFNSLCPNGYNYLRGGLNCYSLTEEHILLISKPIKAVNSKTKEIFYFISLTEPSKKGYSAGSVSVAIKNRRIYKGYYWFHAEKEEFLKNKLNNNIIPIVKFYAKNIQTGEIIRVLEGEYCSKYGFDVTKVGDILNGKINKGYPRKTSRGYTFSYEPFEGLPVTPDQMVPN